jgi:nicotinamidase-related amidase
MADVDAAGDTAVIVIDLQKGMFEPNPVFGAQELTERVRSVIDWARQVGHRLCFIRHDSDEKDDPLRPGGPGWEVWSALGQRPSEPTFSKSVGDAFSQPLLVEWLKPARHVVLLGAQSEYCVAATTSGALGRGLSVTVVEDAHSTWPSQGRSAEEIIAEQNQNFAKLGAHVVAASAVTGAGRYLPR